MELDQNVKKSYCGPYKLLWTYQIVRQVIFIVNDVMITLFMTQIMKLNYSYWYIYISDFFILIANLTYYRYKFHNFETYVICKKSLLLITVMLFSIWKLFNIIYLNPSVSYFTYQSIEQKKSLYSLLAFLSNITLISSFWFQLKQMFDSAQQSCICISALHLKYRNNNKKYHKQQVLQAEEDQQKRIQKQELLRQMKLQLHTTTYYLSDQNDQNDQNDLNDQI